MVERAGKARRVRSQPGKTIGKINWATHSPPRFSKVASTRRNVSRTESCHWAASVVDRTGDGTSAGSAAPDASCKATAVNAGAKVTRLGRGPRKRLATSMDYFCDEELVATQESLRKR